MCHYYTCKYALCGCIYDDRTILCDLEHRDYCPGAELIQVEYERSRCRDCRAAPLLPQLVDSYKEVETGDQPVRSRASSSASSASSSGDTVSGGVEGGQGFVDLERIMGVKYMYCDASRVCDPVVVKRGSRRRLLQDRTARE